MKVAILTRDYPSAIGGIATHVKGLVKVLRARGVEADVYVGSNDVKTLLYPFEIPLKNYDVVHAQSLPYGAFVFGVPLVVTVHSPVMEEFDHYRTSLKVVSIPAMAFERFSLFRAKAVLAVSTQSRDYLIERYRLGNEKVGIIGNGVDYERFSQHRDKVDGGSEMMKVIVVSRLEPRKNVREAVEAVSELPQGSCHLDIVGDGSERESLRELAEKTCPDGRVRFLGRVDESDLPDVYGGAAVFLSTSRSEGFGLSLLEAMSSGCACVVSDLPTYRALVEHDVNGMVYTKKSELVASLRELLSSREKVERLGAAAQAVAINYSWDKVADRVTETYERVVGR
jgi:glycosyltransferase involved in cell wall biosynthesis